MKESGIGRENGLEAFEACEYHLTAVSCRINQCFSHRLSKQVHYYQHRYDGGDSHPPGLVCGEHRGETLRLNIDL